MFVRKLLQSRHCPKLVYPFGFRNESVKWKLSLFSMNSEAYKKIGDLVRVMPEVKAELKLKPMFVLLAPPQYY